jgi:predicted DNA-binding transcriptional regulator AlpA
MINTQKENFHMNFEVLTAPDIAKILKISRATAYEIMERDDFPTIHIGRNKRVMAHEFAAWIKNQTNNQPA